MLLPAATVLAGCAAAAVVLAADPTSDAGFPLPPCPIRWLTGLDCPGCGATRMFYSLLHGDLLSALHYNALAVAFIPFFLWTWGGWVVGRWRGRPVRTWENWRWSPLVWLVLIAAWSVIRNLPFPPFSSLYV
ncbi:membrane protein [Saccharopolyspora subtropica]|nr:membrane protein [Saccharopolyspora subtropica]